MRKLLNFISRDKNLHRFTLKNLVFYLAQNKKSLFLIVGVSLLLSFLPFQSIKVSSVSAAVTSFRCEKLGGHPHLYRCIGTIPSEACNNSFAGVSEDTNCGEKCINAGGDLAKWGTQADWEPYTGYCCNLPTETKCGTDDSITLNAASKPIDLNTGTLPPPALEGCGWTNPIACFRAVVTYIITLPIRISALLIAVTLAVIAAALGVLYTIIVTLLGWFKIIVLTIPIIPAQVNVVQAGWEITRNIANMGIILVLVFIGLATILRIKDYEAKKLLPILIGVALLINFSPVIVGFVVDVANIITNFFLNLGSWETTVAAWSIIGNYFGDAFTIMTAFGDVWLVIGHIVGTILLGIVLILFFGYSAWIYLLTAALLVVRVIILWVLMILSPIVFLFYTVPAGRKLAREWWQALIQWAILAIPLGFFLFLSFKVLSFSAQVGDFFQPEALISSTSGAEISGGGFDFGDLTFQLANAFSLMLVPLVSIIILHIGYKLSRRYMPAAANSIISGVEKLGKMAAMSGVAAVTMGAGAAGMAGMLGKAATGAKGLESVMGRIPGPVGGALKFGMAKPLSWAARGLETNLGPKLLKYAVGTRRQNYEEMFKGMEAGEIAQRIQMLKTKEQRVGATAWMAEKGLADKAAVNKEFRDARIAEAQSLVKNPAYQKSAVDVLETYTRGANEKVLLDAEVDQAAREKVRGDITKLADELSGDAKIKLAIEKEATDKGLSSEETEQLFRDTAARQIWVGGLKAGDVKDIEKTSLKDDVGTRVGMRGWSSSHLSSLVNNFKKDVVQQSLDKEGGLNAMFEGLKPEEGKKALENLYRSNPRLINFFANTPAGREWGWKGSKFMPKGKKGWPDYRAFLDKMEGPPGEEPPSGGMPPGEGPPPSPAPIRTRPKGPQGYSSESGTIKAAPPQTEGPKKERVDELFKKIEDERKAKGILPEQEPPFSQEPPERVPKSQRMRGKNVKRGKGKMGKRFDEQ